MLGFLKFTTRLGFNGLILKFTIKPNFKPVDSKYLISCLIWSWVTRSVVLNSKMILS